MTNFIDISLTHLHLVDEKDDDGCTRLMTACCNNDKEAVIQLIQRGACIDEKNTINGMCGIHYAALHGSKDVIITILSTTGYTKCGNSIDEKDSAGCTPAFYAARYGHVDILKTLISKGCNINATNYDGDTLLHVSCQHNHRDVVSLLLQSKGIDVSRKNKAGQNALFIASINDNKDLVLELISKGCMIDVTDNDLRLSLHHVCIIGCKDIALILISKMNSNVLKSGYSKGGNSIDEKDSAGCTPAFYAARHGHVDILKTLISKGCNINATNYDGDTLLHVSCQHNHRDVVSLLLQSKGIEKVVENNIGLTCFHVASINNHTEVLFVLLIAGFDVNIRDREGMTAVSHACASSKGNDCGTLLFFISKNCDLSLQDYIHGYYNAHYATMHGHCNIIALLHANNRLLIDRPCIIGNTPLHIAATLNIVPVVQLLLSYSVSTDSLNAASESALHIACDKGYLELVSVLIDYMTSNATNGYTLKNSSNGWTALHYLCHHGHNHVIDYLLLQQDLLASLINETDYHGHTPLHMCVMYGHVDAMIKLISAGADVTLQAYNGDTVLHMASANGCVHIASYLISHKPSLVEMPNNEGNTPIHTAVINHQVEVVNVLVSIHAKLALNHHGHSPFHTAVKQSNSAIVDLLLHHSHCDMSVKTLSHESPLRLAAMYCHNESVIHSLLKHGASHDEKCSSSGTTLLHTAVKHSNIHAVRVFIRTKGLVNRQSLCGKTPLHYSCDVGNVDVVEMLIAHKAKVDKKCSEDHSTPLHHACKHGHYAVVVSLLQSGASHSSKDIFGETPLFKACRGCYIDIIQYLIAHGASIGIKNRTGKSCIDYIADAAAIDTDSSSDSYYTKSHFLAFYRMHSPINLRIESSSSSSKSNSKSSSSSKSVVKAAAVGTIRKSVIVNRK